MYLSLKFPKGAGIYMVKNLINGKFYIGASNHVTKPANSLSTFFNKKINNLMIY
jgi:hypothetical protein